MQFLPVARHRLAVPNPLFILNVVEIGPIRPVAEMLIATNFLFPPMRLDANAVGKNDLILIPYLRPLISEQRVNMAIVQQLMFYRLNSLARLAVRLPEDERVIEIPEQGFSQNDLFRQCGLRSFPKCLDADEFIRTAPQIEDGNMKPGCRLSMTMGKKHLACKRSIL
jgi:hypothetical protein